MFDRKKNKKTAKEEFMEGIIDPCPCLTIEKANTFTPDQRSKFKGWKLRFAVSGDSARLIRYRRGKDGRKVRIHDMVTCDTKVFDQVYNSFFEISPKTLAGLKGSGISMIGGWYYTITFGIGTNRVTISLDEGLIKRNKDIANLIHLVEEQLIK